jgi:Protein of unknown function (DUF2975)
MLATAPASQPLPRERLRRMSRGMQALAAAGALLLALVPLWVWHEEPQHLLARLYGYSFTAGTYTPPMPMPWLGAIAAMPGVLIGLFALWQVWQLFASYGRGVVFGAEPTRRLRRLGWALLASALLQPLTHTLLMLALTFRNPPGQRQLVLGLGSDHYLMLLLGGLLIAIAWAMDEGARLQQENEGFV